MDTTAAAKLVQSRIRGHQRGIYCRAVMWEMISAAITVESVEIVLDSLTPLERTYLRDVYAEWPPSLWSCRTPEEHAVCAAVERWCQQAEAS